MESWRISGGILMGFLVFCLVLVEFWVEGPPIKWLQRLTPLKGGRRHLGVSPFINIGMEMEMEMEVEMEMERERERERGREGERERERGREGERERGERERGRERARARLRGSEAQPLFGPSVSWLCHPCITTAHLSYRFPIFETSATALCGTTGNVRNS